MTDNEKLQMLRPLLQEFCDKSEEGSERTISELIVFADEMGIIAMQIQKIME